MRKENTEIIVSININCQTENFPKWLSWLSAGLWAPGSSGGSPTGAQCFRVMAGAGTAPGSPCPQPPRAGAQPALQSNDGLFGGSVRGRGSFVLPVRSVSAGNCWDGDQPPFFLKWVRRKEPAPDQSCPTPSRRAGERKTCLLPPSGQSHGGFPDQNLLNQYPAVAQATMTFCRKAGAGQAPGLHRAVCAISRCHGWPQPSLRPFSLSPFRWQDADRCWDVSSWAQGCTLVIWASPLPPFKVFPCLVWLCVSRKWQVMSLFSFQVFHATSLYLEAQRLSGKAQWTHEVLPIGSDIFPPFVQ